MALDDQRAHKSEQQREQQRADVLTVDVGVGHQHEFVVTVCRSGRILPGHRCRVRRSSPAPRCWPVDPVQPGLSTFRILPRMGGIASMAGRVAPATPNRRRVALDDEDLALFGIRRRAVDEFARAASPPSRPLRLRPSPALRAAIRATDACTRPCMSPLPSPGSCQNHSPTGRSPPAGRTSWPGVAQFVLV